MLSYYVNVKHDDWDQHINLVTGLYNSTVSLSTGYTPYYLMFGRENARVNDVPIIRDKGDEKVEEYAEKLVECLALAWEAVSGREHLNANRENVKMDKKKKLLDYFINLTVEDQDKYERSISLLRSNLRSHVFREYEVGDRFFRKRHLVQSPF